ncbi:MAG: UrcA family protein [Sphingopyxis sp.]|nr:UrcA family protein [Sphingopyxis sp.]
MTRTLILALSLAAAASPVAAAETETTTATVRIDDLNLTRAGDRDRLDLRVKSAARLACRSDNRGAAESVHRSTCMTAALADADRQTRRAIAQARGDTQLALLMVEAVR